MSEGKQSSSASSGIGLSGVLLVVFIVMKLAGVGSVASWPWIWVLSPLWISWALVMAIFVVLFSVAGVNEWMTRRRNMREFE